MHLIASAYAATVVRRAGGTAGWGAHFARIGRWIGVAVARLRIFSEEAKQKQGAFRQGSRGYRWCILAGQVWARGG